MLEFPGIAIKESAIESVEKLGPYDLRITMDSGTRHEISTDSGEVTDAAYHMLKGRIQKLDSRKALKISSASKGAE